MNVFEIPILSISQIARITNINQFKLYKVNSGARDNLKEEEIQKLKQLKIEMENVLAAFKDKEG